MSDLATRLTDLLDENRLSVNAFSKKLVFLNRRSEK